MLPASRYCRLQWLHLLRCFFIFYLSTSFTGETKVYTFFRKRATANKDCQVGKLTAGGRTWTRDLHVRTLWSYPPDHSFNWASSYQPTTFSASFLSVRLLWNSMLWYLYNASSFPTVSLVGLRYSVAWISGLVQIVSTDTILQKMSVLIPTRGVRLLHQIHGLSSNGRNLLDRRMNSNLVILTAVDCASGSHHLEHMAHIPLV